MGTGDVETEVFKCIGVTRDQNTLSEAVGDLHRNQTIGLIRTQSRFSALLCSEG